MHIVFMGTPHIAEEALVSLLAEGHEVAAVYTRPDKPVGRKQVITSPPVKVRAAENRIPVMQPKTLRTPDAAAQLAAFAPELVVVVAYGLILPPQVLTVPKYGCVNLHVSLLPQYRGAAPIQWAVINGEERTGVSVMQMDEGLDTGPVLSSQAIDIPPQATAGEVFGMAEVIGARLLAKTVVDIADGIAMAKPQQGEGSYAPPLDKKMAEMDFSKSAKVLHNLARGCNPWPLAWFIHKGKRVKALRCRVEADMPSAGPGEILGTAPLVVACGEHALVLEQVHPEGGRAMTGGEWAAGRRLKAGDCIEP